MKAKPIYKIDDLGDLLQSEWKQLRLQTYSNSTFKRYLDQLTDRTEAKDLLARTEFFNVFQLLNKQKEFDDVLDYRVANGTVAILWDYHYLQVFKQDLISRGLKEDIDFHISSSGEIPEPFFTVSNKVRLDDHLAHIWDKMQVYLGILN